MFSANKNNIIKKLRRVAELLNLIFRYKLNRNFIKAKRKSHLEIVFDERFHFLNHFFGKACFATFRHDSDFRLGSACS